MKTHKAHESLSPEGKKTDYYGNEGSLQYVETKIKIFSDKIAFE